ncbi:hypothetical protein LJC48_01115 [Desulfovibrio sp. OttesenSCG-928-C06]|nr:hypothetical protein [Desulfovibrio sp. OttesenSCG-928-C06]
MKYAPPLNATAETGDGYWNASAGKKGAVVPAEAIEPAMRELVYLIEQAGLTPDDKDLTQVYKAFRALFQPYKIGKIDFFDDRELPDGWAPCYGDWIEDVSQKYPRFLVYLQSPVGAFRRVTEEEYEALHVAAKYTYPDGSVESFNGLGGVNKFVWDEAANRLRLPDLRGLFRGADGYDSLGVGDVDIDRSRRMTGEASRGDSIGYIIASLDGASGVFTKTGKLYANTAASTTSGGTNASYAIGFDSELVIPTGGRFAPAAFYGIPAVYLG